MPNSFKNTIKNNIGTTPVTLYTATGVKSIFLELDVSNTTNSGLVIYVTLTDVSEEITSFIVKGAPLPVGSAIQVINGQKIVLEEGDFIQVYSSLSSSVDAIGSLLEDVQ